MLMFRLNLSSRLTKVRSKLHLPPFRTGAMAFCYGLAIVLTAAYGFLSASAEQKAQPVSSAEPDKVVARVNGEPVYAKEIDADLPTDAFAEEIEDMRKSKLERMIAAAEYRQFLKSQNITVAAAEVDRSVAELEKNPPSLGCPCCRYPSLAAFLKANGEGMAELREALKSEVGLTKCVMRTWNKRYPTKQSLAKLIVTERQGFAKQYRLAWQIFFNTFQQPDSKDAPERVKARATGKANAAWKRLQSGESFANVAREVSEDQTSRNNGGSIGFIRTSDYGKDFEKMLSALKPNELSRPFPSVYGYHIIKWAPVPDADLVDLAKTEYMQQHTNELMMQIQDAAKVEKY